MIMIMIIMFSGSVNHIQYKNRITSASCIRQDLIRAPLPRILEPQELGRELRLCSPSHPDASLVEFLAEHSFLLGLRGARRPVSRPAPNAGEQELLANQPSRECVSLAYPD